MAQSPCVSPSGASPLTVVQLNQDPAAICGRSAMAVKLTDECIAAIHNANLNRIPMKMRIDSQGGVIELGTGERASKFRFVIQQLSGTPSEAIAVDSAKGYRSIATFHSKLQVQATDKAFAETREKAQKLAEEEKKKAVKDVTRLRRDQQRPVTVKRATNQVAIGAKRPSPSSSNFAKPVAVEPKLTTHYYKPGPQVGSVGSGSSASVGVRSLGSLVRAEISRKPLRKRVIHLIVLGRFHSAEEVLAQLRKDSVNGSDDESSRARDIIDEVSETGKDTGRLQLKQSFYNEVDSRWPGFNSDEKAHVRKILSANTGSSSNFAPTRKSGIAPPLAPSASHVNNVSPEAIPTPPTTSGQQRVPTASGVRRTSPKTVLSGGSSVVNNKTPPAPPTNISTSASNPLDDLLPSTTTSLKRKALAPAASVNEKRARQQSLSPPEDPSSANPASAQPAQALQKPPPRVERTANTTEAPPPRPPLTLMPNVFPSRDWTKEFPDPKTFADAEKYYDMFLADYPQYMHSYNYLASVANEFKELKKQLSEAPKNSRDHDRVEKMIFSRYSHYQREAEFLHLRQVHADLREKLGVLKQRIANWESSSFSKGDAPKTDINSHNRVPGNLLVM